jgi:hypothetical protein
MLIDCSKCLYAIDWSWDKQDWLCVKYAKHTYQIANEIKKECFRNFDEIKKNAKIGTVNVKLSPSD